MFKRKHIPESFAFKANKIHKVVEAPVSAVVSFTSLDATNSAFETEGFHSVLMNGVDNYSVRSLLSSITPPASRLVGIELNPGPPKKGTVTTTVVTNTGNKNKNKNKNVTVTTKTQSLRQTNMPSSIGFTTVSQKPNQRSVGKTYRVSHKELLVSSIPGSTTFTVQNSIYLNPGLVNSFPWLSQQAQNWEQYRFLKLNFEYIPIASTAISGDVMLIPDYDPTDPMPQTELEAVNSLGAMAFPVWQHTVLKLDPLALHAIGPRKFLRDQVSASDLRTTDCGQLFVCTNNCAGTTGVGKLFVDYEVEFFVPQTKTSAETTLPKQTAWFGSSVASGTILAPSGAITTLATKVARNPLHIAQVGLVAADYYAAWILPKGVYRADYTINVLYTSGTTAADLPRFTADINYDNTSVGVQHGIYTKSNFWHGADYFAPGAGLSMIQVSGFGIIESDGIKNVILTVQDSSTYVASAKAVASVMFHPA